MTLEAYYADRPDKKFEDIAGLEMALNSEDPFTIAVDGKLKYKLVSTENYQIHDSVVGGVLFVYDGTSTQILGIEPFSVRSRGAGFTNVTLPEDHAQWEKGREGLFITAEGVQLELTPTVTE